MAHRIIMRTVLSTLLLAAASSLWAQMPGTLTGRVIDQRGNVLQGVRVRIIGHDRTVISHTDGSYLIAGLQPGTYEIKTAYVGYQPITGRAIIGPGLRTMLDFRLPLGCPVQTDVTVQTGRPAKTGTIRSITMEYGMMEYGTMSSE